MRSGNILNNSMIYIENEEPTTNSKMSTFELVFFITIEAPLRKQL
jgi:hypothetical protein